jgi:hypothetical protein
MSYDVPGTADERMSEFTKYCDEFKAEFTEFKDKQKKVSGHRARKALLNIAKLTRFIRKDVQASILALSGGKKDDAPEAASAAPEAPIAPTADATPSA